MHKFIGVVTFVVGAAVGGAASWFYAKKKYEQIAQEEIDSVKDIFSKKVKGFTAKDCLELGEAMTEGFKNGVDSVVEEKTDVKAYAAGLSKLGYTDYSNPETEKKTMGTEKPYVISPDDFDELDGYSAITLTYYDDGVLADELNDRVEDIDEIVGVDYVNHFGEYEEDSVYIRNDVRQTDYEILMDLRKYSDVLKTMPPKREDL